MFDATKLFRALGTSDEEKAATLKKLLEGSKTAGVQIGDPVVQPSLGDVQPQPQAPVDTSAPAGLFRGTLSPPSTLPGEQSGWTAGGDVPDVNNGQYTPGGPVDQQMSAYKQAVSPPPLSDQDYASQMGSAGGRDMSPVPPPEATPGLASPGIAPPVPLDIQGRPVQMAGDSGTYNPNALPANPTSDDIYKQIQSLDGYKDPHHHSLAGRLFKSAGKAWKNWDGQGGLIGLGLDMAGEAIAGAASPGHYEGLEKQDRERPLFRQLGQTQQQEKYQADLAYKNAQTATIPIDDANNAARTKELADANAARLQAAASRKLAGLPTFDPNNVAHRRLAKDAGLTEEDIAGMKGWDFKNPVEHVIDGERFKLNRADGEYYPTNLPVDESKSLTTFDALDENGRVVATYHLPEDKAAQYAQQFRMKNMELKARKDIAGARIDATAGQKDLDRKEKLRQWVHSNQVTRVKFESGLMEKVKTKKMTKEQADQALADFDEIQQ